MKYIDLSYNIYDNMPKYPGDKDITLECDKNLGDDGYTSYILNSNMHAGTHVDAPMHLTKNKLFINEYDIDNFYGRAVIIDVRNETIVHYKEGYSKIIKEKDIVIFYTGYDKWYGRKEYYENHPVISEELCLFLINKKIKMIGFDMPSPDREPYKVHSMLLKNNIFILENLCNLDKVVKYKNIDIMAAPLKIKAEASLVRAIGIIK